MQGKDDRAKVVVMTKEEKDTRMVQVARQAKIPPRLERAEFVVTDAKGLVLVGPLLEWDSTEAWTIVMGIIKESPSRSFSVIVFSPTNALLSL